MLEKNKDLSGSEEERKAADALWQVLQAKLQVAEAREGTAVPPAVKEAASTAAAVPATPVLAEQPLDEAATQQAAVATVQQMAAKAAEAGGGEGEQKAWAAISQNKDGKEQLEKALAANLAAQMRGRSRSPRAGGPANAQG